MITNNLSTLKIHELTREQYNRLEESNTVQPNEIYLIKNDSQPVYTVNGISPDENGNVQLPIKNDSSPIYTVNSMSPDENGNILLSIKNDSLPIYSINDISPDENGNISLSIKNDSLPIYTVNGVSPDENGNIQIAEASLDTIIPETLSISKGGTGATTAAGALTNLGLTATATELNYVDGVTSNIQTQLNGKVSTSRTINNKALSSNITLSASDVGALATSGGTVTGTLILSKTTDASGTSNTSPALIVGGPTSGEHIVIDGNEIIAKSNATTPSTLYLGDDTVSSIVSITGCFRVNSNSYGTTLPSTNIFNGRIFFKKVT